MEDQLDKNRSIYDAKAGEVFWKNFLAGFGRALGGSVMYLAMVGLVVYAFMNYAYPKILPFIQEYQAAVKSVNQLNKTTTPGTGSGLTQYQQLIKDLP